MHNRRNFLKNSTAALTALTVLPATAYDYPQKTYDNTFTPDLTSLIKSRYFDILDTKPENIKIITLKFVSQENISNFVYHINYPNSIYVLSNKNNGFFIDIINYELQDALEGKEILDFRYQPFLPEKIIYSEKNENWKNLFKIEIDLINNNASWKYPTD